MLRYNTKLFLMAVGLGFLTSEGLGVVRRLPPHNSAKDAFFELLTFPGAWVGGLFYPEGVHTGSGAPAFILIAYGTNLGIFVLFWLFVLVVLQRRKQRAGVASPDDKPSPPV